MVKPDPTVVYYLNHAGTSWPKPAQVLRAAAAAMELPPSPAAEQVEKDRQVLRKHLGMIGGDVLLTPGCTSALAIGVSQLPWVSGDRVLLDPLSHVALEHPVRMLSQRGVRVELLPHGEHPETLDIDAIESVLASKRVRAVAVSAANNVTGAIYPLAKMRQLCEAYQVCLVVDAAQVAGWWMELGVLGDLVAFGGHKGLQGPWGIGGLYMSPSVQMHVPRNETWLERPNGCDVGSVDRVALSGLVAAAQELSAQPAPARLIRAQKQIDELENKLGQIPGVNSVGIAKGEQRMPILAITVDGVSSVDLGTRLLAQELMVAYGLQCAPLAHATLGTHRYQGVVRISVGPSTTDEVVDAVPEIVRACIHQAVSVAGTP